MRKVIKLSIKGIVIALLLYLVWMVIVDIMAGGNLSFSNFRFSKNLIGVAIIGVGFAVPGVIYEREKLSYLQKTIIQMSIGGVVLATVGYFLGWITPQRGIMLCFVIFVGQMALAVIVWSGYALYGRYTAKKINKKLEELNKEEFIEKFVK